MRIVAGAWKGRMLAAPSGDATRPTADRARQALFDMLFHAPWGGRDLVVGARVLDGFAGTGALGLEALSRGAAHGSFFEANKAAVEALKANIASFRAHATIFADVLKPPRGQACSLAFLDPPYGDDLLAPAVAALRKQNWLVTGATVVTEMGRGEDPPELGEVLAERVYGAAKLVVYRLTD